MVVGVQYCNIGCSFPHDIIGVWNWSHSSVDEGSSAARMHSFELHWSFVACNFPSTMDAAADRNWKYGEFSLFMEMHVHAWVHYGEKQGTVLDTCWMPRPSPESQHRPPSRNISKVKHGDDRVHVSGSASRLWRHPSVCQRCDGY